MQASGAANLLGTNNQFAAIGHAVAGVDYEIREQLAELVGGTLNRRNLAQPLVHGDTDFCQRAPEKGEGIFGNGVEIESAELNCIPVEAQHLADNAGYPLSLGL